MSDVLMKRTVFHPDITTGTVIVYILDGQRKNGLVVENNEDTLKIAIVGDAMTDEGFQKEVRTVTVDIEDIESETVSLAKFPPPVDIKGVYAAYKNLSEALCSKEHLLATLTQSQTGREDQEAIDARHTERMDAFRKSMLLKKIEP